jgi:hypothetical protein
MLKSRRMFPPGGWQFFQPETNWFPPGGLTFDQTVDAIIKHRNANPRFDLPNDVGSVSAELDEFTCLRIRNDPNYCDGFHVPGGDVTKKAPQPSWLQAQSRKLANAAGSGKKVAAGIAILIDWLGHGAKPVEKKMAESRAALCGGCPLNAPGDLTSFFTVPASETIRRQIEIKNDMKLETAWDKKLGVCTACACPLKTKCWTPLNHILKHMSTESIGKLDPRCWMLKEKP